MRSEHRSVQGLITLTLFLGDRNCSMDLILTQFAIAIGRAIHRNLFLSNFKLILKYVVIPEICITEKCLLIIFFYRYFITCDRVFV